MKYGVLLVAVAIVIVVALCVGQSLLLQFGWNYLVVDEFQVTTTRMSFKMAVVAVLMLGVIGNFFRSSSSGK